MYSLVLMSAMTTAPGTAEFNGFFRDLFNRGDCSGCSGCNGAARYSCYGGCSGTADYNSCSGCCGGSAIFGLRDRVRTWWNADGCCGGGCCGGVARSYGCCGGVAYSCHGSAAYSCFGGPPVSYTPVFNGGLSCHGGPVPAAPAPVFEPYPAAPAPPMIPGAPAPSIPYAEPTPAPPTVVPERSGLRPAGFTGPPTTMVGSNPNGQGSRAVVVVRLPADAKLYADGAPLKMTGGERKFATPELPAGMEYTYRFTAEYERNGEVVSVTKKVAVRAGGSAAVEFADLTSTRSIQGADVPPTRASDSVAASPVSNTKPVVPSVLPGGPDAAKAAPAPPAAPATGRATITVKLPPGAALYVDDRKSPSNEPVRQLTTPPLPAGREFAYLLKAEITRNGQPEQLIQKVTFRAGEQIAVDFTALGAR